VTEYGNYGLTDESDQPVRSSICRLQDTGSFVFSDPANSVSPVQLKSAWNDLKRRPLSQPLEAEILDSKGFWADS
jgi:hypothetical protein